MATKDITDEMVCKVVDDCYKNHWEDNWKVVNLLSQQTGQPSSIVLDVMEEVYQRGLMNWVTGPNQAWLTEAGKQLITKPSAIPQEPNHV
jgi:hypothetical protein